MKHAHSITHKKRLDSERQAGLLLQAVEAYKEEQKKPTSEQKGYRAIANQYPGVSYSTLRRRIEGKQSISTFNTSKLKLKVAEEDTLVQLIEISSDWSNPLTYEGIANYANKIGESRVGQSFIPVGKNWVCRLLERRRDRLQTYWSKPLDTQRARSLNPEAVRHWFKLVEREIVDAQVLPENIYGMDESGFPPSDQGTVRVIGRRGNKLQHKQGSTNRENATGLIGICADGTALHPLIIFKSEYMHTSWFNDNVSSALFTKSPKGWTDTDIALEWLIKVFDPETSVKANGKTRVLLMDGHNSHFSLLFLNFCVDHHIVVICYPAHCTHALQGLDVACFAKMKTIWHAELNLHYETKCEHINKSTYRHVFGTAFNKAFDKETILAAFSATGVHPFNASAISERQMKPSEVTSTRTTFPLPMTSPVRRIMATFHHQPATSFEQDMDTYRPYNRDVIAAPLIQTNTDEDMLPYLGIDQDLEDETVNKTPKTPTRKHTFIADSAIDPSLFTPTKRAQILSGTMAQSNSGSFLISRARINSANKPLAPVAEQEPLLPEPDWTLIHTPTRQRYEPLVPALQRDNKALRTHLSQAQAQILAARGINEAANAQLVIQHMHADRMNSALHERENRPKKKKHDRFGSDGKGLVYTSQDVMEIKRRDEEEVQEKVTQKEAQARFKANKTKAQQENMEKWDQLKTKHNEMMKTYRKEVEVLQAQKVPKRLWPKAPSRPKKPDLPLEFRPRPRKPANNAYRQGQEGSGSEDNDNNNSESQPEADTD